MTDTKSKPLSLYDIAYQNPPPMSGGFSHRKTAADVEAQRVAESGDQGFGGDAVDAFQMGAGQSAAGMAETVHQITGSETAGKLRDATQNWAEGQMDQMSDSGREAMGKQFFSEDENGDVQFGEAWSDPESIGLQFSNMAGQWAGKVVTGFGFTGVVAKVGAKVVAKNLIKRGLAKGMTKEAAQEYAKSMIRSGAGVTGQALAGAGITGGQMGIQVRDEIMNLEDSDLDESNEFRKLYYQLHQQNPNATVSELRKTATKALAERVATSVQADPLTITANLTLDAIGGRYIDNLIRGVGTGKRLTNAGMQAIGQGIPEAAQGGMEQFNINRAMVNEGVDTDRDLMEGVATNALNEGVLGAGMGGAMGALTKGTPREKPSIQEQTSELTEGEQAQEENAQESYAQVQPMPPLEQAVEQVKAERGQYRGIDDDIRIAEQQGFEDEAVRLRAAKRNFQMAEEFANEGDAESAKRFNERALKIYREVTQMGQRDAEASEPKSQLPAEYVAIGEYLERTQESYDEMDRVRVNNLQPEVSDYDPDPSTLIPDSVDAPYYMGTTEEAKAARQQTERAMTEQQGQDPGTAPARMRPEDIEEIPVDEITIDQEPVPPVADVEELPGPDAPIEFESQSPEKSTLAIQDYEPERGIDFNSADRTDDLADRVKDQIRKHKLPKGLDDGRLLRSHFRSILQNMSNELVPGGGVTYVRDKNDRVVSRTPSQNPKWFQDAPDNVKRLGVKGLKKTIDQALKGRPLGKGQARAVRYALDHITAERNEYARDYARPDREDFVKFRKVMRGEMTPQEAGFTDSDPVPQRFSDAIKRIASSGEQRFTDGDYEAVPGGNGVGRALADDIREALEAGLPESVVTEVAKQFGDDPVEFSLRLFVATEAHKNGQEITPTSIVRAANQRALEKQSADRGEEPEWTREERREPEAEEELLTSYTEDDLRQMEAKRQQDEKDDSESERKSQQKAKADAEVDSFSLAGSDADADQAAAAGQSDLLQEARNNSPDNPESSKGNEPESSKGNEPEKTPAPAGVSRSEGPKKESKQKSKPAPKPTSDLPEILTATRKSYLKKMARKEGLKPSSPGYESAMQRIEDQYETDVDRAQSALSFEQFNELNSDSPEGVNRQAWESLREEYGEPEQPEQTASENDDKPIIRNSAGNPYKNKGAARKALKKHPGYELVEVEGGFELHPVPEGAAEAGNSDIADPPRASATEVNDDFGPDAGLDADQAEPPEVIEESQKKPKAEKPARPKVENKIFTEDAAEKARALLKKKLGQMNSGIDPEILQAGLTLAGYHIEKGARTFAAFAKAMTDDLGNVVKPYLKSWYMGVKYDPRAAEFEGLDSAGEVESADIETILEQEADDALYPARDTQRDSGDGADANAAIEKDIPDERPGESRQPATQTGTDTSESRQEADPAVDIRRSPDAGERSNKPVSVKQSGLEPSPSRDTDHPRSDSAGTGRLLAQHTGPREADARPAKTGKVAKSNKLGAAPGKNAPGDAGQISERMPFLDGGQVEDVAFIENRLSKPDGYGVLLTNGTGTGKTFSGMGYVRRLLDQGKSNILIVTPSRAINDAWREAAKGFFDVAVEELPDTRSAGAGVVVTTFANFGANNTLFSRSWDAIVIDEAHKLSQNEDGKETSSLRNLRGLAMQPRSEYVRAEALHTDLYKKISDLRAAAKSIPEDLLEKSRKAVEEQRALIEGTSSKDRPRALMLSATPFAYEKNVRLGQGFLFDWGGDQDENGGYNSGGNYERFMMEHFGYRMRYNKLTEPDAKVDRNLLQRNFNSWLKSEGVLRGRTLETEFDYDRKFIKTENALGHRVDEALKWLMESREKGARDLREVIVKGFDYHTRMYFLEGIKAQEAVPIIRKNLNAGRKVLIMHGFKKGGITNPFRQSTEDMPNEVASVYDEFSEEFSDLISAFSRLPSAIDTLKSAFPDLMIYNGDVSNKDRLAIKDRFNDDGDMAPMLAQGAAMREGVSLHDTTGNRQRVLLHLGMPSEPTATIQQEGRIYRVGQASDAMFRYLTIDTSWERFAFASRIAQRSGTAENLAMGEVARGLKESFIEAYEQADEFSISPEDGKGGKALDRSKAQQLTEWDKAKAYYYGTKKQGSGRSSAGREGTDYFATPEPVGLKMVELANIRPGEDVLEPSGGHGAIARWFPGDTKNKAIEPSADLASKLSLRFSGDVMTGMFEDHHIVNKYDAIVMNPPYGHGGKTAADHVGKAGAHLRDGGRIVALIPTGPAADKQFDKLLSSDAMKDIYTVADIKMPSVTFERAGTKVSTRILVLEKQTEKDAVNSLREADYDYSSVKSVDELFNQIEDLEIPDRIVSEKAPGEVASVSVDSDSDLADLGITTMDSTHSKKGHPLFVVNMSGDMGDRYEALSKAAKNHNGYYIRARMRSHYKPNGGGKPEGTPTFTFSSEADRSEFLKDIQNEGVLASLSDDVDEQIRSLASQFSGKSRVQTRSTAKQVRGWLEDMAEGMDSVEVVETSLDLPGRVKIDLGAYFDSADGAYDIKTGKTYIVAGNIRDQYHAKRVFLHEVVGHGGVINYLKQNEKLGGKAYLEMLDDIYYRAGHSVINKDIDRYSFDYDNPDERRIAVLEYIAHLAEKGKKMGLVQRVIAALRDLIRKFNPDIDWTDTDTLALIEKGRRHLQTTRSNGSDDGGVVASMGAGVRTIFSDTNRGEKLYHGTNAEGFAGIQRDGVINGPVFLTPRKDVAIEYGGDHAIEVGILEDDLLIDLDLPGARLLTVDEANDYLGNDGWSISKYLDEGYSVGVNADVVVHGKQSTPSQEQQSQVLARLSDDLAEDSSPLARMSENLRIFQRTAPLRSKARDLLDSLRFQTQDKLIDLKNRQREIDDLDDSANAYQKAAIWEGRAGERINDFDEEHVQPLLEKIAESGLSLSDVGEWLVARHAKEANEYLAEINPDKPDSERYRLSGMSNDEADAILSRYRGNIALSDVGDMVDRINTERVDMLINEGLITEDMAGAWRSRYKNYVPLNREEAEGGDYLPPRGQGFQIKGKESKMRTGSAYWKPDKIISHVIANFETSIVRAEKNKVGEALLKFVEENPDEGFWSIDTERKQTAVRNGKVVETGKGQLADNELGVKRNGVDHVIVFNRGNEQAARLAKGLKNLQAAEMNTVMRTMAKATRFLAMINTSFNPEFMVTNFFRDVQTAAYNLSDTKISSMQKQVLKDIFPAGNGIRKALFGNGEGEWSELWEDFRKNGGKTGWIDLHSDIKEKEQDLVKTIERIRDGKSTKGNLKRMLDLIENSNTVVENGVRLAAYKAALDNGLTKEQAAALAKDLTVNFNRKGAMGPQLNAFYMFFNAAVQGNVRLLQAMVNSKKGRMLAYGTVGFAIMLDIFNRSAAGDDDDGENLYDSLPDYVKERNIIIMGEKEPLIKIPAPWGYNVLHVAGQEIGRAISGERFDPMESAGRVAMAVANSFNPLSSGSISQMLSPTVTDPIVMIAENKNFAGNPLKPEHSYDSQAPKPEYLMHFSTARSGSKWLTEMLNDISGGNEVRPGAINISPENIDLLIDTLTGGVGRLATNSGDLAARIITGEDIEVENVPFLRQVHGYDNEYSIKARYYEWTRDVAYAKAESRKLRGEELAKARREPAYKLIGLYNSTERRLRVLRKQRRKLEKRSATKERIEALDKRIRLEMARFNRQYIRIVLAGNQ